MRGARIAGPTHHATIVPEYDEAEQDPKRRRRNSEEIDGNDVASGIVQEGSPRVLLQYTRRWRLN